MHHPPFSSSVNGSDWRWSSGRIQSWGASAVVAGHDHTYERIMRDGFTYFVNGAGGYPLYPFGPPVAGSTVRFNADYGAMLVEVDKTGATFQFITARRRRGGHASPGSANQPVIGVTRVFWRGCGLCARGVVAGFSPAPSEPLDVVCGRRSAARTCETKTLEQQRLHAMRVHRARRTTTTRRP